MATSCLSRLLLKHQNAEVTFSTLIFLIMLSQYTLVMSSIQEAASTFETGAKKGEGFLKITMSNVV